MKLSPIFRAGLLWTALTLCSAALAAAAAEPTALQLIKAGNDYVGKDAKDKVVQIRSEKSIGTLIPNIWYVSYYDADASGKTTEVKFGAGEKMAVKHPFRPFTSAKPERVFDKARLKIDSDTAIKTATSDPLLKNLTLKATQLWLEPYPQLSPVEDGPVWTVRLWAAKLKDPNSDADIGEVFISAADGKVLKIDLHIDRVD
jgi:hypothetical protein